MSFNQVTLIGNLGIDPEKFDGKPNGQGEIPMYCRFSLATNKTWMKNGEKVEDTQWHRIAILSPQLAKIALDYCKKGSQIMVQGEISYKEYEKDGVKRYSTDIILGRFGGKLQLLGKKDGSAQPQAGGDLDDEIPF